jgi:hypothetical protein
MPWVTMQRKESQEKWRLFVRGGIRVPTEVADVEVPSDRRCGPQATEARKILRRAVKAGLVPTTPVSGARYVLPLRLTRGCETCRRKHAEEEYPPEVVLDASEFE